MDPAFEITTEKEDLITTALANAPDAEINPGRFSIFAITSVALYALSRFRRMLETDG